jgi:hypothetical protein
MRRARFEAGGEGVSLRPIVDTQCFSLPASVARLDAVQKPKVEQGSDELGCVAGPFSGASDEF